MKLPGSLGRPLAALLSVVLIAGSALAGPTAAADPGEASHPAAPTPRLGVGSWPWAGRGGLRASALPANGLPEPGVRSGLLGTFCISLANCWAVGDYVPSGADTLATLNLALHWNGRTWSQVVTPDPGGFAAGDDNELRALRCTSSTNCWAVGFSQTGIGGPELGEALHWNGTSWSAA